jgi:hypothetical protein
MIAAYVRTAQVRLSHTSERLRKVEADRTGLRELHHGPIPVVSHVSFLVKILSALTRNATLSSSKLSAVSQTIFAYSSIFSVFYLDVTLEDLLVPEFEERVAFFVYDKIYGYRPTRSSSVVSFRTQMDMTPQDLRRTFSIPKSICTVTIFPVGYQFGMQRYLTCEHSSYLLGSPGLH